MKHKIESYLIDKNVKYLKYSTNPKMPSTALRSKLRFWSIGGIYRF